MRAAFAGGVAVGSGAAFPFALIVLLRPGEEAAALLAVVVSAALLAAGAAFGLLAQRAAGGGTPSRAALTGAGAFAIPMVAGSFASFPAEAGLGALPLWAGFLLIATVVAFVVGGVAALALGLALRVPRAPRAALAAGGLAALTYALVILALEPVPGWHVGGGERAMVKVALVGNFLAGLVGGGAAIAALARLARGGVR